MRYTAWLIEAHNESGTPVWLTCDPMHTWTPDAWEAFHFCRKSDCERLLSAFKNGGIVNMYGPPSITEHIFDDGKAALTEVPR